MTFKELQEIDSMVADMYQADPTLRQSKFGYAYKRFYEKNYAPILKEFQEELDAVRVDNALTDEKTKEVLFDKESPRGFKFDKEGLKRTVAEENRILTEYNYKEIAITPFISAYKPEMTEEQTERLTGLVI